MRKIILIMILGIFMLSLVSAETEIYQTDILTDLRFICTLNNAIPGAGTEYNITISYPNGSTFLNNVATTSQGNGAFNYTTTFPESGIYKVQMFCYDGTYSYSNEGFYNITSNGNSEPEGVVIVLFSILFLIIISLMAYEFIVGMGHFASLDLDVIDLAKSFGIYFAVLGVYLLSKTYFGNPDIEGFILLAIQIGAFTHIIVPLIGFLISITIGGLRKKKMDWGIKRIYRRPGGVK